MVESIVLLSNRNVQAFEPRSILLVCEVDSVEELDRDCVFWVEEGLE